MDKLEILCVAQFLVIFFGSFICAWVNKNNETHIKQEIATTLCSYQNYFFGYYQTEVTYKDADNCKDIFQDRIICSDGDVNKTIYIGEPYKYGYCSNY